MLKDRSRCSSETHCFIAAMESLSGSDLKISTPPKTTQTTLKGDAPDWEPWVGFFLRCLKKQKNNLAQRLDAEQLASDDDAELPEISLKILALLRTHDRRNIVQITEATGANRNTLKLRLRELV